MQKSKYPIIIITLFLMVFSSSCTLWRIVRYRDSEISNYKIFSHRDLKACSSPFRFSENPSKQIPNQISYSGQTDISLDGLLKSTRTVAFIVLKGDTLHFEDYYNDYSDTSICYSFSTAKSFLFILIGYAIDDGYINSVDHPVTDFSPELKKNGFDKVTIKHLLQMTSGMVCTEPGFPLGLHFHFYYTQNLKEKLYNLTLKEEPGISHSYKSNEN